MKTLVGLLVALTPVLAHADKSFNDGQGGTWDCATDATVSINANSGVYTLKGACKVINVNGNDNRLTIDKVGVLSVNGNNNANVVASADGTISVNGNDNKVDYKAGTPKVSSPGNRNKISGPPPKK